MTSEIHKLMADAFARIAPTLTPDELRVRLARRRSRNFARPPRPFCVAVRANDLRINPNNTFICPEDALLPASPETHLVHFDSPFLRFLVRPVNIPAPGMEATEAAHVLGISTNGIYMMIKDGRLLARYIPRLGGKRGKPVPLVHTRGHIDPCASRTQRRGPDKLWDPLWHELPNHIPDNLDLQLTRTPFYRTTRGQRIFIGWRWRCPACNQTTRSLYLPLDLPDFAKLHNITIPDDEQALAPARPRTFACAKCHRTYGYSATNPAKLTLCWNHAILHLSSGLLFGHEVPRPTWLQIAPAKLRYHLERDPNHLQTEATRLRQERFTRLFDANPIYINGKLNPIFNDDDENEPEA